MGIRNREGALYWATGIDNSGLKKGKAEAVGLLKTFTQQISGMDVFAGLGAGAALAFAKITKEAYAFSKEFQTSMKEVQTISKATQENYEGMSAAIVKMSREVPDSAVELSRALYEIVSAGYDGAEGLAILEAAAKGAVAGVTTTTVAADGLTTILNAWKLSVDDINKVNDVMFRTVELGKVTYDELAGSIAQVAPLAAASGVSFEEIGAAVATLTKQGTPAAQAITQIRSAMVAMNEQLGMGWGNAMSLQEGFQALLEVSNRTGKQLNEVTGRVEGAMAVLATTGKNAQGAAEDIKSIGEAAGSTEKAFKIMVESADSQMNILSNNVLASLKDFGDKLVVAMGGIAKNINEKMRENAEKRDNAIVGGIKREITILESELKTLDNPIDTFFFGKDRIEEKRKKLQDQIKVLSDELKSAQANLTITPTIGQETTPISTKLVDPVEFQKELDSAKKAYDEYNMLVTNGFKKEADTFYWMQLENGKSYKQYLQNILKDHEHDVEARKLIYLELSDIILAETEKQMKAEEAAFIPMSKRLETLQKFTEAANSGSAFSYLNKTPDSGKSNSNKDAITSEMFQKISAGLTAINQVQSKSEKISRTWDNIIADVTNPEAWSVAADGVREIGYMISSTNQELGEMMLGLSDMMDGFVGALTSGASPAEIIQSSMQAFAGLIKIFQAAGSQAKTLDDVLADMNRKLEEQQRLLELSYRKGNQDSAFQGNLDALNKQKNTLEENIKLQEAAVLLAEKLGFFGRLSAGINLSKLNEDLQKYKDQLNDVKIQIEDLGQSWIDFTAGLVTELDLADSIAQAFADGKTSAKDFADYMNDVLKDAVLEVFKAKVLGPQLTKAQEYLSAALVDGELTESEIAKFNELVNLVGQSAKDIWDKLNRNLSPGQDSTTDNSLTGSIRASLTEETGSILAGTMNAMRLDLRELVGMQLAAVDSLVMIEENTRKLHSMDANILSLKDSLTNSARI